MESINSEKLINEVAKHPILYNLSNPGYRDNDRKNNVWRLLAAEFNCSGNLSVITAVAFASVYLRALSCRNSDLAPCTSTM